MANQEAQNSQLEVSVQARRRFQRSLLSWFASNQRELPWRLAGTPYAVWVSEIMCQQTRVEVVRDYYLRWMQAFPTLEELARAEESDVLKIWQGLGYYSRARRLQKGARYVVDELGGKMPDTPEGLQKIPGVGPYSAGAIASIAFARPVPAVDGNVIRVLTRIFALEGDPNQSALKKTLWRLAGDLVPQGEPGSFNQAVMELGALVCTPRSPSCIACPWRKECAGHKQGRATHFPQIPKKAPPTERFMGLILLRHRARYALKRLPSDAPWWAGLDAFPFIEAPTPLEVASTARNAASALVGLSTRQAIALPELRHTVTRFKIRLVPHVFEVNDRRGAEAGLRWLGRGDLEQAALPAPHRAALQAIFDFEQEGAFGKKVPKN